MLLFCSIEHHSKHCYEVDTIRLMLKKRYNKKVFLKWWEIRSAVLSLSDIDSATLLTQLQSVFLTREDYRALARLTREGFEFRLQEWVEEMEELLKERRKEIREVGVDKDDDFFVRKNGVLFQTELTSAGPVAWRLMRMFMDLEEGKEAEEGGSKMDIVKEILELQEKNRKKRLSLWLLLAFLKAMDPLFRSAKLRVLDARDKLQLFRKLVRDPKMRRKMDEMTGEGGPELFEKDSKIEIDVYRETIKKMDEVDSHTTLEIKTRSKPFHEYFSNHRDLVHQLVFMDLPLFKQKSKNRNRMVKLADSDWSESEDEPDPAKYLEPDTDDGEDQIRKSQNFKENQLNIEPLTDCPQDSLLAPLAQPEAELEAEPEPAAAMEPLDSKIDEMAITDDYLTEFPQFSPCKDATALDRSKIGEIGSPEPILKPDPKEIEREVLKWINQYRKDPKSAIPHVEALKGKEKCEFLPEHLAETVEWLKTREPVDELRLSKGLSKASRDHVEDVAKTGKVETVGSDGSSLPDRVNRYGKWGGGIAENIARSKENGHDIVMDFLVDGWDSGHFQRKNMFAEKYKVAGAGCAVNEVDNTWVCVIDVACSFDPFEESSDEEQGEEEVAKQEAPKVEETKVEETKEEETKVEAPKVEEPPKEKPKEEPKQEEPKQEEPKQEETKKEDPPKQEEPKKEETMEEEDEPPAPIPGTLICYPKSAQLTRDTELFGKMDPFCEITIGSQILKTKIAEGQGKTPVWTDTLTFTITEESQLLISVKDDDWNGSDLVGERILNMDKVTKNGGSERWVQLFWDGLKAGKVLIKFVFKPDE